MSDFSERHQKTFFGQPEESLLYLIHLAEHGTLELFVTLFDILEKRGINVTHCEVLRGAFRTLNILVIDFLLEKGMLVKDEHIRVIVRKDNISLLRKYCKNERCAHLCLAASCGSYNSFVYFHQEKKVDVHPNIACYVKDGGSSEIEKYCTENEIYFV